MAKVQIEKADEPPEQYAVNGVKEKNGILVMERPNGETWYLPINQYDKVKVIR